MPIPTAMPVLRAVVLTAFAGGLIGAPPSAAEPSPGSTDAAAIVRLVADEVACPPESEMQRAQSPDGKFSALWCEMRRGGQVARHGPYLELYADGSTYRQGAYHRGVQAGHWARFSADGKIEWDHRIRPGEAGRYLPQPLDVCPQGTRHERYTSFSDRREMGSKCYRLGEDDAEILEGPYITWVEESTPRGKRYLLRRIMTYRNDQRHGRHLAFEGPYGREVIVEEEVFADGSPEGESRAYYSNGSLREVRHYSDRQFHGQRVAYFPDGKERWRIVYERGRRVEVEGDLRVAGEPCPDETVPTTTVDGLEDRCARRYLHFEEITGPFQRRDRSGTVVESGLYRYGEKVELWQTDGEGLPPEVPDDVLVAEATMMLGEEVYLLPTPPESEEETDPWDEIDWQNMEAEEMEAEVARINALVEAQIAAEQNPELEIWFRDTKTKKYPHPRTEIVDGKVKIYGLRPGRYYMRVEHDADRSSPRQYPGDLTSSSEFEVKLDQVTQFEAPMLHSLHVVEPWDNNQPLPGFGKPCGEEEELPRRVRFAWKTPPEENPEGIEWEYRVRRLGCDPYRQLELIVEGRTHDRSVEVELGPSGRAEAYEFTLVAWRGEKAIGQMMSFGKHGGHGWAMRFRSR